MATNSDKRISIGQKHLKWVPVSRMRVSPRAQRGHNTPGSRAWIDEIAANYDPDKAGVLEVNLRDDIYWVMDGGHRYHAYLEMGWEDQQVQCWVFEGLTEAQEADFFLDRNRVKPISPMDKFQKALVAKRELECDIDRIVRAAELTVGRGNEAIGCVGAITKTYKASGPSVLATTLRVIRDSYGMRGFSAKVTEGAGLFVANYENGFDESLLVQRLSKKTGGVNGLLGEAERIKKKFGVPVAVGVAAAIVDTYNNGRGGNKLNGWWSTFNPKGAS